MEDVIVNVNPLPGTTRLVDTINGNYGKRGIGGGGCSIWGASTQDYAAGPAITMGDKDEVLHSMQLFLWVNGTMDLYLPDEPVINPAPDRPDFRFDVFGCEPGSHKLNDTPVVQSFVYEHPEWEYDWYAQHSGKGLKQCRASLFTVYFDPIVLSAHQRYYFAWNPANTERNYTFNGRYATMGTGVLPGVSLERDFLIRWANNFKRRETDPDWLFGTAGLSNMYPCVIINVAA